MSESLPNDPRDREAPPNAPRNVPPGLPAEGGPDSEEHMSRGAHGRYGIEEEENNEAPPPRSPKTPDQIERDAARDAEVRNTGEDLGRG
jgi:hypothetical protein